MNGIARMVMSLFGLVFLAGLLAALGLYLVFATVRWLLTGRKPQVVMVWQQFSALRRGGGWGAQPGFGAGVETPTDQGDIVDVEAREVHPDVPHDKRLK